MSASDEVINGWRECADPVELAAARAAGVEVERNWGYDWHPGTANVTAEQFAGCLKASLRYRVPASWSWPPEPPAPVTDDDLRERITRAIWEDDERAKRDESDDWDAKPLTDHEVYLANADAVLAVLPPQPAPSPVPPWPGAVLSGLVDEDGVPTWLAQAGQVRGEQVRGVRGGPWRPNTLHYALEWVEVRAPRPAAATERVPWWEAVGRRVLDQDGERVTIEHVQCGDGAGPSVTAYNASKRRDNSLLRVPIPVRGDGTVEVLKDGDQ